MSERVHRVSKPALSRNEPSVTIRRLGDQPIVLTLNEYRLALIGLVDFEGDWAALATAATLVADAEAKSALVHHHLMPVAEHLSALLERDVDGLELLAVRHWFRSGEV
jgi:hypothetical protein